MALTGKIMDFFADKAMTIPAFPRTKVKAISDDSGIGLDAILSNIENRVVEAATTETYKGTFLTSSWSSEAPYTQTITVSGVLSTDYPFVDIDLSNTNNSTDVIEAWRLVGRCTVDSDNTVIAYCYEEKPTVDIPIIFKVVR